MDDKSTIHTPLLIVMLVEKLPTRGSCSSEVITTQRRQGSRSGSPTSKLQPVPMLGRQANYAKTGRIEGHTGAQ